MLGALAVASVTSVVAASAAFAASTDTSATLSSSASTPTSVTAGSSTTFTIDVWASGSVPAKSDTVSGVATVTTLYNMASDGTITASSQPGDQQQLQFTTDYQYNQCPAVSPPQGCATNPFTVTATLSVASGTAAGTNGTLTVSETGSNGLSADGTPASGYVTVGGSSAGDTAPSPPGAPTLDPSSTSPNNDGAFTVDWTGSTDSDGDSVTYTLEAHNADSSTDWVAVASGLTSTSDSLTGVDEGSWRYRVEAVDSNGTASNWATDSNPIAIVDKHAPNAPTLSAPTAVYTDSSTGDNWYNAAVSVTVSDNGDPDLQDTSPGSGVDPTSFSSPISASSEGENDMSATVTDYAGNESSPGTLTAFVDTHGPSVTLTCPAAPVVLNSSLSANWTASDGTGSGVATGYSTGSVIVPTNTVGPHSLHVTAGVSRDNVGNTSTASNTCSYNVAYAWSGFLQPINDTAHFIGETTSIFKAGSTVPVKFQLTDATGAPVQEATPGPVWLTPQPGALLPSTATVDESSYSTTDTPGGYYRWDSTGLQYIYNWNTSKSMAGKYWRIGVHLDDGNTYYVSIGLK